MMKLVFWLSALGVIYPYVGYPAALWVWARLAHRRRSRNTADLPTVSLIVPVHNEQARIERKVANTVNLQYPRDRFQVLFVSDGSTDGTVETLRRLLPEGMSVLELSTRGGKAAALNAGLRAATGEVVVFSDASIELEPGAVATLVAGFADPAIGCISGEDRIEGTGGEALYGRYELMLRRLESDVHSIAGASGSFYAQRRSLCAPFLEGLAPDFLSVLRTVEGGYRAVSEPGAVGSMTSVKDPRHEFERKVRTLIRGMTTLVAYGHLLNPFRWGALSFVLLSHKVARWLAPVFLVGLLVGAAGQSRSPWYAAAGLAQLAFYAGAVAAGAQWGGAHRTLVGRVALYFSSVNLAILAAAIQYCRGVRQELWTPSNR